MLCSVTLRYVGFRQLGYVSLSFSQLSYVVLCYALAGTLGQVCIGLGVLRCGSFVLAVELRLVQFR